MPKRLTIEELEELLASTAALERHILGGLTPGTSILYKAFLASSDDEVLDLTDDIVENYEHTIAEATNKYVAAKETCKYNQECLFAVIEQHGDILPEELKDVKMVDVDSCIDVFKEADYLDECLDKIRVYLTLHTLNDVCNVADKNKPANNVVKLSVIKGKKT